MKTIDIKQMTLVLLADRTFESCEKSDIKGDKLEMISDEYFSDIMEALGTICKNVVHYQSPKELIDNIHQHKGDIIFTIYGGSKSRNRMALVPGVCESYDVKFMGADVYARILCQDKFLSKEFAKQYNIKCPESVLVNDSNAIPFIQIKELRLPLVIKPNFEGSSIGIDERSKVDTHEEAFSLIRELGHKYGSVLVEEFVPGREVCICVVGNKTHIRLFEAMEVYRDGEEYYLYNRLYTAGEKHLPGKNLLHRNITSLLTDEQKKDIINLYCKLGKMDYMRIDGRMNQDGFVLIELTPDGYLGEDSAFADAASENGKTYTELLEMLIRTSLESYHIPYSNYTEN